LIKTAVSHFKSNGLQVERASFDMTETVEICSALMFSLENIPSVLDDKENLNVSVNIAHYHYNYLRYPP
jgi:hypothetical protein